MAENKCLKGQNLVPRNVAEAKALIGKNVIYLRECDIDKSGRGYFFPKQGVVTGVHGRNIEFNGSELKGSGDFVWMGDLVEVEEVV